MVKALVDANLTGKKGAKENLRPPVVVLLGHVDHGKTTLLDTVANASFAKSEFGEITQSIRALQVRTKFGPITFIDTPGHAFFANLRDKGLKVADIALLVVSATEGVKEQTIESVKLANSTKTSMICVISKIDQKGANAELVKKQLAKFGVLVEGGQDQVPVVEVSSVKKTGIDELIETISILATYCDLSCNLQSSAKAIVLESFLDKKAGPTSLVLVKDGVLKVGSLVKVDGEEGKIRGIFNQQGVKIATAAPGQPVKILGLENVVSSGSQLTETDAYDFDLTPRVLPKKVSLFERELAKKQLAIILKADSDGSRNAILANLPKGVKVVDAGVGQVTAADVERASAASAKIFGFDVSLTPDAAKLLEGRVNVFYSAKLIYELIEEIKKMATSYQVEPEKILGVAKVLKSFDINGIKIAGCKVLEGYLEKGAEIKIFRGEKVIGKTKISSIKQYAKPVTAVKAGSECGIGFSAPIDFAIGDVLKFVA